MGARWGQEEDGARRAEQSVRSAQWCDAVQGVDIGSFRGQNSGWGEKCYGYLGLKDVDLLRVDCDALFGKKHSNPAAVGRHRIVQRRAVERGGEAPGAAAQRQRGPGQELAGEHDDSGGVAEQFPSPFKSLPYGRRTKPDQGNRPAVPLYNSVQECL